jgi:hypothetical protein
MAGPRILNKFVESRFCSTKWDLLSNLSENRLRQSASDQGRESRIDALVCHSWAEIATSKIESTRVPTRVIHTNVQINTQMTESSDIMNAFNGRDDREDTRIGAQAREDRNPPLARGEITSLQPRRRMVRTGHRRPGLRFES